MLKGREDFQPAKRLEVAVSMEVGPKPALFEDPKTQKVRHPA
jgi:hypothetical protein